MADGFIWYELVTNDMDKAVEFYKKVVGWDIKDSGARFYVHALR
jgi:predicted enzyme related to lactoylglutathione lyase